MARGIGMRLKIVQLIKLALTVRIKDSMEDFTENYQRGYK